MNKKRQNPSLCLAKKRCIDKYINKLANIRNSLTSENCEYVMLYVEHDRKLKLSENKREVFQDGPFIFGVKIDDYRNNHQLIKTADVADKDVG